MAVTALRLLRPLVAVASFVAPAATGRLAFKAFCTPPRRKQGANRGDAVKSIVARLAQAQRISVPFPCGSVVAYLFEPPGAAEAGATRRTVILLHGWTGEAAFMTAFVAPLLTAGFRVVAYDLPAHGGSTGRELNIPIGVASLTAVARVFAPVHAIVTHSFGGSIAMAALARTVPGQPALKAARLALISAPASMQTVSRHFGATIGLGARGQAAMERRIHAVAGAPVTAFEGASQLAAIALPTLVVHCRNDKEVGFEHAQALAAAGPFVSLETMQGLGHRRILQSRKVAESIVQFLVQ